MLKFKKIFMQENMKKSDWSKLMLEFLYDKRDYSVQFFNGGNQVPEKFISFTETKGLEIDIKKDSRVFRETFWELVSQNLAVIGSNARSGGDKLPYVSITEYGAKCWEEKKILPYNPDGFLDSLCEDIPDIDEITKLYFGEAISCFHNKNFLASMVMVGGAIEKTVEKITELFYSKLSEDKASFKTDVLDQKFIKTTFDNFLKFLEDKGYKNKLDFTTKEKLESLFPAIVNLIRITRNETGHPTGREIDRDEAEAYLLLAKEGIRFAYSLVEKLAKIV